METNTTNTTPGSNGANGLAPAFQLTLNSTFSRITNPVISPGNADNRTACRRQKDLIQRKQQWNVTDAVRWAFYTLEGEADGDQTIQEQLVSQAAAVLTACLAKVQRVTPEQLYVMFGVKPGSAEGDVLAAQQCAMGLQEELAQMRLENEQLVEGLKAEVTTAKMQADALREQLDAMTAEKAKLEELGLGQMQEIEKLRGELQTSQATSAAQSEESPEVVSVIRQRLATAMELIESQKQQLDKFRAQPPVDEEVLQVLDLLNKELPKKEETLKVKLAIYYLMHSLVKRV